MGTDPAYSCHYANLIITSPAAEQRADETSVPTLSRSLDCPGAEGAAGALSSPWQSFNSKNKVPELVPLDLGQNSVQNRGSFASGAPSATRFVAKNVFSTTQQKNKKYA